MQKQWPYPDSPSRYGSITRWLHWAMGAALLWMFSSAGTHLLFHKSALDKVFWPTHKSVGALIMALIIVRAVWALANANRRPPFISMAARCGHFLMYVLMLLIPSIGLLRQYGSGKPFSAFGIPLMSGFAGEKIQWTHDLGENFHSLFAWILLALVLGHIAAAIMHWRRGEKEVVRRMIR